MHEELISLVQQVEANERDAVAVLAELSHQQFNWCSVAGQWSVGQCLQHLNATNELYMAALDEAIDEAHAQGLRKQGPFCYGWISRKFAQSMEPPVKLRIKSPKKVMPSAVLEPSRVIEQFSKQHQRLQHQLKRCSGIDLAGVKLASPFFSLLRIEIGIAFAVICAHDRRHLWQAREIRRNPEFCTGKNLLVTRLPLPISHLQDAKEHTGTINDSDRN